MLTPANLHDYQRKAILHQLYYPDSMLWLDMGLGKTIVTLSTIEHRMRAQQVQKTLIWGPLRVIHSVWEKEARNWSHTKHLRFSVIHGTPRKRERQLFSDADVYLCNYENMAWLSNILKHYFIDQGKPLPFQFCVYDEVSKMKNAQSQRMLGGKRQVADKVVKMLQPAGSTTYEMYKNAGWKDRQLTKAGLAEITPAEYIRFSGWKKMVQHFPFKTGLTGTPAPNGYIDLHGQYLAVDGGERLGEYITHYRDSYFEQGYDGWTYQPSETGKLLIENKVSDITIKMDAEDYLDLPELITNDIMVDLPDKVMQQYREVEKDMFTRLDDGTEIEVFSKTSISNKCLQFCNGSPYKEPMQPEYSVIHDEKFKALDDIIEEAAGEPVVVSYTFRSDAHEMMKRYAKKDKKGRWKFRVVNLTEVPAHKTGEIIEDFIAGKIRLLIGHPASMGHGIDGLQKRGNILVWFGLTWNLEFYEQMIKRLKRQGQSRRVVMHRIMCKDTIDLAVADALKRKDGDQTSLKNAIQRYRDGLIPGDGSLSFM
jgi:SNF2 family DNA or RNA helicase